MTTGRGDSIMMRLRQSRPFISGIFTSSVTTSGWNDLTRSRASLPLRAKRISKSPSAAKIAPRSFRISAESSAIKSLIMD